MNRLPNVKDMLGYAVLLAASRRINGVHESAALDLRNFQGRARVLFSSSLGVGTTPVSTPVLQQRETTADAWENVPAAALPDGGFSAVTDAANAGTQEVTLDVTACKRYVKLVNTITGAAGQGFDQFALLDAVPGPRRPDTAI